MKTGQENGRSLKRGTRSYEGAVTALGATETCEGLIRHLKVVTELGVIEAPVRLITELRDSSGAPHPLKIAGELAYAWPGGGIITVDEMAPSLALE